MCTAIAIVLSDLPAELLEGLASRIYVREEHLQILYEHEW